LQVWGEPEFKRESVEDFGIVFWGELVVRRPERKARYQGL
jgi:hypothetical protein